MRKTRLRGFTLVELLVVVALMGIMMSIALVAYQATRVSARDARRKGDLEIVRSALEMYRSDCGRYPDTSRVIFGNSLTSGGTGETCVAGTIYMASLPVDPLSTKYKYGYTGTATSYSLCAYLEGVSVGASCTMTCEAVGSPVVCTYKTTNP